MRRKPVGRPRKYGLQIPLHEPSPAPISPPSLPPAEPDAAVVPPTPISQALVSPEPIIARRPRWTVTADGKMRRTALKIVAMRAAGMTDNEIAPVVGLKPVSIRTYLYKAGKSGFLDFDDPKDRIEYQMLPKVLQNLTEALDSGIRLQSGMAEKTAIALKIAEGTVFKRFEEASQAQPSTVVAIKIEMPDGPRQVIREGTIGGTPAYTIEGETASGSSETES